MTDEQRQKIARKLRELRGDTDLMIWSRRFGSSHQLIWGWEHAKTLPSAQSLIRLAEFTNVSLDWLLLGD